MLQQTATGTSLTPGPNAPVSEFDRLNEIERGLGKTKLINPQVQFFGLFGNFSRSNYNAAQFSARKRLATGFTMSLNYTLSKSMDTTSAAEARGSRPNKDTGDGMTADALNPDLSYALSDFDRRHQFNSDFLVDLPFGTGHFIGGGASPALNSIIGGWHVSSIVVVASGRPWNFTASDRFNRHFAGRDQAVVIAPIPFELTKQNGSVFMIPGTSADRASIAKLDFENSYPGGPVGRNQGRGPWILECRSGSNKSLSPQPNPRKFKTAVPMGSVQCVQSSEFQCSFRRRQYRCRWDSWSNYYHAGNGARDAVQRAD